MQREVYPALLLFPAERKKAIVYEGDLAVNDIIKFVAEQGSNSQHLINQKGNFQLRFSITLYCYSYHLLSFVCIMMVLVPVSVGLLVYPCYICMLLHLYHNIRS